MKKREEVMSVNGCLAGAEKAVVRAKMLVDYIHQ